MLRGRGPQIAADALVHQGVRGIEHALHRALAVALLAFGDVALGEAQVVDDVVGLRPHLELVVVLEEVVVPVGRVRDHQRLHGHGVLLHDVADAGVGIDDQLVGEAAHAALVVGLVAGEALAERPVPVHQRHADRGVGIEHLLGGDHLDLVGIDVEAKLADGDLGPSCRAPCGSARRSTRGRRTAAALARSCAWEASSPVVVATLLLLKPPRRWRRTARGRRGRCPPERPRGAWRSSCAAGRRANSRATPASPANR